MPSCRSRENCENTSAIASRSWPKCVRTRPKSERFRLHIRPVLHRKLSHACGGQPPTCACAEGGVLAELCPRRGGERCTGMAATRRLAKVSEGFLTWEGGTVGGERYRSVGVAHSRACPTCLSWFGSLPRGGGFDFDAGAWLARRRVSVFMCRLILTRSWRTSARTPHKKECFVMWRRKKKTYCIGKH